MYKITKQYTNFDGKQVEEDFYFNFTEQEITEMMAENYDLAEKLRVIVATKDDRLIAQTFKELTLRAYGKKSADGRLFVKDDRIRKEFESTQAFSDIYMDFARDADAASRFVNGILPDKMKKEIKE